MWIQRNALPISTLHIKLSYIYVCTNIHKKVKSMCKFCASLAQGLDTFTFFAAFSSMQNNVAVMHNCTLAIAKLPEQCVRPPFFLGVQGGLGDLLNWALDRCWHTWQLRVDTWHFIVDFDALWLIVETERCFNCEQLTVLMVDSRHLSTVDSQRQFNRWLLKLCRRATLSSIVVVVDQWNS